MGNKVKQTWAIVSSHLGLQKRPNGEPIEIDAGGKIVSAQIQKMFHLAGVFCELSKAFNCEGHKPLIGKTNKYSILGNSLHWFKSFFSGRKQRTYVLLDGNKSYSVWEWVRCGVQLNSINSVFNGLEHPMVRYRYGK